MPALRELHLGVNMVPLVYAGGWGGAAALRHLTALTTLEAVNLDLHYKWMPSLEEVAVGRVAPLLRDLGDKQVHFLDERFIFAGQRPPAAVLGMLRAAALQLDLGRCVVREAGEGSVRAMAPSGLASLWQALTAGPGKAVKVDMCGVEWSRDVLRHTYGNALGVPAARLGDAAGLESLSFLPRDETPGPDRAYVLTLGRQLHKMSCLKFFNFSSAELGSPAGQVLLQRLSALSPLQSLVLRHCCIGAGGGVTLAGALPALPALTRLDLGSNDLGEQGAVAVMAALSPVAAAGLTSLDLGWNRIGLSGAAALAARLPEMMSLQYLCLTACRLPGAEGVRALHQGLKRRRMRLTALTSLNLDRNFLECGGAVELAGALASLPNLSNLSVRANAIGVTGGRALARRLLGLQSFDLSHNRIGAAGAVALARAFRRRFRGREDEVRVTWDLSDNAIGDAGAVAIGRAFCSFPPSVKPRTPYAFIRLWPNDVSARVSNDIANRVEQQCRHGADILLLYGGYWAPDDVVDQEDLHHAMAA